MTPGSSMLAITSSRPPQRAHCSISILNTRCNRRAQWRSYWNSPSAYPMETLDPEGVNDEALERLRRRLAKLTVEMGANAYAEALRGDDLVRRMIAGDWPMQWSANYRFRGG